MGREEKKKENKMRKKKQKRKREEGKKGLPPLSKHQRQNSEQSSEQCLVGID